MLKDVTLGQYFPGNSLVHKLDPRTKLLMVILYFVALFSAKGLAGYLVIFAFLAISIAISGIPFKSITRGLKPLIIIVAFTGILNLFYTDGSHIIFQIGKVKATWEGAATAGFMISRIIMLITGTFLLTYTTSPIALTDGLESLLGPLKKMKVPVHELAMMMCIALRFIPTLIEETDKIICAQKARGADFESGNILQRAKALIPILVPLFISAFHRADELAIAMESRCYQGGKGRTKLKQLKFAPRDYWTLLLGAVLIAVVIVLKRLGIGPGLGL